MGDRQVKIVIAADVAAALRGLQQVEQGLGNVANQGNQAGNQTGGFMDKLQTGLAVVGVDAGFSGIVSGFKSVVSSGMEYEQNMNMLQAVSGATSTEMQNVGNLAKELGNDLTLPGASAQSAAAAMTELAKGGLTLDESMSAVRGTLILAAAAQIDGAQAAEIQSSALNTFGLAAADADRVANVLANTANASAGEITDFAQGLSQAGTIANSFGWSIEETSTYLGLMANAGIKGSDAGTSLKTTLTSLLNPTKQQSAALQELGINTQDANGNMISASALTDQLAAAKGRMTDAEFTAAAATAFGSDAVRTALVAADAGAAGYDQMSSAIQKAGGAQEVAAANAKGLSGALDVFTNSAQTAGLALYEKFSPALEDIVGFATGALSVLSDFAGWFADLPGFVQAGTVALVGVVAMSGPLNGLATSIGRVGATLLGSAGAAAAGSAGFAGWIASVRAASGAAATFGVVAKGALSVLGGPIGLAIVGVTTALAFMGSTTEEATTSTADFTGAVDENTGALTGNAQAVIAKSLADAGSLDAAEAAGISAKDYTEAVMEQGSALEDLQKGLQASAVEQLKASGNYESTIANARRAKMGTEEYIASLLATGDASEHADDGLQPLITAYQMLGSDSTNLATQQRQVGQALDGAGVAIEGTGAAAAEAAPPMETYAEAIKDAIDNAKFLADNTELEGYLGGAAAAADQLSSAMDYLSLKFAEIAGRNLSAEEAAAALNAAYRGVEAALKDGTKAATDNSEAGQLNIDAMNNWDVAALTATDDGAKMYDQLNNLVDAHAQTTAAAYLNAIATGDVAGAAQIARDKATLSRQAFVQLASQYNGGNIPAAEDLANKLGILDGTQIQDKEFETILDDAVANGKLTALQAQEIRDKTFGINAEDNATPVMKNITNYQIADKTYTIRAITVGSNAGDYVTASGQVARADGGMVPGPHAAAGMLVAGRGNSMVMDGSGAGLTWAEAATNKEYYLSMKAGMEQRNRGLASQAVSDLGGQTVWGRPDVRAGSFSAPAPQRIIVELRGEGITAEMARTAIVTVNGALVEVAQGINRVRLQS